MYPCTFIVALILFPAILWAQDPVKRDEHQMHGLHNDPKAYIGVARRSQARRLPKTARSDDCVES